MYDFMNLINIWKLNIFDEHSESEGNPQ